MSKRQSYSREFKLEAVRLLNEGKKTGADLARELGIKRNQLKKRGQTRIILNIGVIRIKGGEKFEFAPFSSLTNRKKLGHRARR